MKAAYAYSFTILANFGMFCLFVAVYYPVRYSFISSWLIFSATFLTLIFRLDKMDLDFLGQYLLCSMCFAIDVYQKQALNIRQFVNQRSEAKCADNII